MSGESVQHAVEKDAPDNWDIPVPACESDGCPRLGYVKSERWGMRLCPEHAVNGPSVTPPGRAGS